MAAQPAAILLDPIGGVSGDMFLAAVLDAWPALQKPVLAAMSAALPAGYDVALVARSMGALPAAGLDFSGRNGEPTGGYEAFRERIGKARLPSAVRRHALEMLRLLAEAEAAVHRVALDQVHFHELADWDTQADIVGAAAAIDCLDGASWHSRPLPLGSGTVRTAHGRLPLPAPATAALLKGFAFRDDDGIAGERVTPTGAAILRYLGADARAPAGLGRLAATGTGAGTRQFAELPNVLRVLGFARRDTADSVLLIEFEVDDQSPEELAAGLDRLRALPGVRDVTSFAGIGKKGRFVQSIRVMADPPSREAVVGAVFEQTTTLGLRLREEERAILPRRTVVVAEARHAVRVKVTERPRGRRSAKPEADDIAAQATTAAERASLRRSATRKALRLKENAP